MAILMPHIPGTTNIQAYDEDRDRLNELAGQLTAEGPGRFGQRETIRWLLDWREKVSAALADEAIDQYAREQGKR